jgi:hypothetical protein
MYRIMSSANMYSLTFSFLIWIPFISCSCLIALARNSKTILINSGESKQLCLRTDFKGNSFGCSPFSMMLVLGLSYIAFITLRNIPLFQVSSEFLSWKGVGFCQKLFLQLLKDHVFFVLASVYILYYVW